MSPIGDRLILSGTPEEEELVNVGPVILIPKAEQILTPIYSAAGTDPEVEKKRRIALKQELYRLRCEIDPGYAQRELTRNEVAHRTARKGR